MMMDPQFQRRLLAASGFAELSLFQEAVQELEELPESAKEFPAVLVVWLEVYQRWEKWAEAESVATRLVGSGTRRTELAGSPCVCDPAGSRADLCSRSPAASRRKFPNCGTIQFNLACYAAQLGQLDEARGRLGRAIQLDKGFAVIAKTDPDLEISESKCLNRS